MWAKGPYATELYSHVGQEPYPLDFDRWENNNTVAEPQNTQVVNSLKQVLRVCRLFQVIESSADTS